MEGEPVLADFYSSRAAFRRSCSYAGAPSPADRAGQSDFSQVTVCDYLFARQDLPSNLDDNELFIYQRLYELLAQGMPTPDLVITQTPTDGCAAA
jgi:hypothetical protein